MEPTGTVRTRPDTTSRLEAVERAEAYARAHASTPVPDLHALSGRRAQRTRASQRVLRCARHEPQALPARRAAPGRPPRVERAAEAERSPAWRRATGSTSWDDLRGLQRGVRRDPVGDAARHRPEDRPRTRGRNETRPCFHSSQTKPPSDDPPRPSSPRAQSTGATGSTRARPRRTRTRLDLQRHDRRPGRPFVTTATGRD